MKSNNDKDISINNDYNLKDNNNINDKALSQLILIKNDNKEEKNFLFNNEIQNIDLFSFSEENKKIENSSIIGSDTFDKEIINNEIFNPFSNLTKGYYKKIPYNKIKNVIQQDNIIYKKNNNLPLENYNKRCKFLGKKVKRERFKQKTYFPNIKKNYKSDIYSPFKFSTSSFKYKTTTTYFNGKNNI